MDVEQNTQTVLHGLLNFGMRPLVWRGLVFFSIWFDLHSFAVQLIFLNALAIFFLRPVTQVFRKRQLFVCLRRISDLVSYTR